MAEAGVQIDWSNKTTADVVSAARRGLAAGGKSGSWIMPKPAPAAAAPAQAQPATTPAAASKRRNRVARNIAGAPGFYALTVLLLLFCGVAGVWRANVAYAPEMYDEAGMIPAAKAHADGKNYAVFDLNLNIRRWKEELVARLDYTPDLVVVGASQWQEAHAGLVKSERMFNGHIHRDYWEDILGVAEVYVRNKKLPKRMMIAIRDKQFTPVESRKDFLWEPGIANYRKMADRLRIPKQSAWETYAWQRLKERLTLSMLFTNVTRWHNAEEHPHATSDRNFAYLDTLLPDGSILWSGEHQAIFTPERTRREALALADTAIKSPLLIDPLGVKSVDALLGYLKAQGVQVILVHPPYNPIFYDAVKDTGYAKKLDSIRGVTRDLASKHGLPIIGEFDPAKVGCTAEMYIDAEHSNPACLQNIFNEYEALLPKLRATEMKARS